MSKIDSLVDNKLAQNIFIWSCFFIIFMLTIQGHNRIVSGAIGVLLFAPTVYVQNLLILPYLRKNKVLFILFTIINILLFTLISTFFLSSIMSQESYDWKFFYNFLGVEVLAILFGLALKVARDSFSRRQEEKEAELKLLKGQLNPHFLFNTLNNLYGLSVVKSDKLPELMLKLSDLLRYSLYETREVLVPLKKEVEYLENYISLEKIRLEEQTVISFVKEGNLEDKKIAPMLLIVFVENTFKHLGSINDKSNVEIKLKITSNTLEFLCTNTYDEIKSKNNLEKEKSGIGLQNVKKRLELIYPNRYKLKIRKKNNEFIVELKLNF
ncbi:Two-component system sensor histidine kinase [Tenacibaculum sp. 190524A02b]|uniref:Two-component system sensor histidine kinase n=1 Tax=Tenacibaculum vairaonense TaxID=3137860 RepID=A0ABP1F5X4_9FLAO